MSFRCDLLDAAISQEVLKVLQPAELELALAALHELEIRDQTIFRQWQMRLERARSMLTRGGSDLRICEVAWQCGFANAAHFSRTFKQQYGASPKDVQRTARVAGAQQAQRTERTEWTESKRAA